MAKAQKTINNQECAASRVLLLGNGIHRAFNGEKESWNNLLNDFVNHLVLEKHIPFFCFPSDKVSASLRMSYIIAKLKERDISKFPPILQTFLEQRYQCPEYTSQVQKIQDFVWNHYSVVLTTNIDKRIEPTGTKWESQSKKKRKYSTFRRKTDSKDTDKIIFYIHGCLDKEQSICLDLNHYLGEAKCAYELLYPKTGDDNKKVKYVQALYSGDSHNCDFTSWLAYIFFKDVDIIGQALSDEEVDIWWALSKRDEYYNIRKANIKSKKKSKENVEINTIRYFYASCDNSEALKDRLLLLRALHVEPVIIMCNTYQEFYEKFFNDYAPKIKQTK